MNSLQEIEAALSKLPPEDFEEVARWIEARREAAWEQQLEKEIASGNLDQAWARAQDEIAAGETTPLDEFLRHP